MDTVTGPVHQSGWPRIAHLCPPFVSGSGSVILRSRSTELQRRGVPVRLLIPDPGPVPDERDPLFPITEACPEDSQLGTALQQYDPDWIVNPFIPEVERMVTIARHAVPRSRILVECQVSEPMNLAPLLDPSILHQIDGLIVPSPSTAEFLRDVLPVSVPISIVSNVVEPSFFCGSPTVPFDGPPIVLWVGRFEPVKNWPAFVEICDRVRQAVPIRIWVVGGAWSERGDQERFRAEMDRRGLTAALLWADNLAHAEMPKVYSQVRASGGCLVSTSFSECHPIAVLEAMAARCPVVASAVRGVTDEIIDGETGWLFPSNDIGRAVGIVTGLLDGSIKRGTVVKRAAQRVTYLTAARSVDQILAAIGHQSVPLPMLDVNGSSIPQTDVRVALQAARVQLVATGRVLRDLKLVAIQLHREVAERDRTVEWLHREVAERDQVVEQLRELLKHLPSAP